MPKAIVGALVGRRRALRSDAGMTLIELTVSMALMSTVLLLVTAGMSDVYRSARRTEAMSDAQDRVHAAWQRLRREVRYATAVGTPQQLTTDAGNWHVAFTARGACVELRLNVAARTLDRRDQTAGTGWRALATGVVPATGQVPFTRSIDTGSGYQQLSLRLAATGIAANSTGQSSAQLDMVALNSSATRVLPTTCAVAP